ncbi:GtrA family protein [Streptomyces sp. TS71-3]|uniref:GtrA family protein n=1 Tax=Streptomyces sp. TS71-3 TaxID=2733862 RepID=UPI001B17EA6D|nr:GtrA family protein [Streptomyces sp. TS71-3]GHJ35121.1 hypothetical protein Sm713_07300 [Streptomyces sp. TS71-3]
MWWAPRNRSVRRARELPGDEPDESPSRRASWHRGHSREVIGFAAAGLGAYAADLALFVWLRGPVGLGPLTAKAASFLVACSIAYTGNALVTYRGRHAKRGPRLRRYCTFFAVNLAGATVQLLCIAVSHYGLGLTSARADTVSGAGVGMVLGTALRFWGTRTFVFSAGPAQERPAGHPGPGHPMERTP